MDKLRFLTAGESHGQALSTIVEGVPAGLDVTQEMIAAQLKRRQRGYGRGGRMQIEKDVATILSGVRYGKSLGSPISLIIYNKDWPNWTEKMTVEPVDNPVEKLQMPRPGHADFAGMVKYQQDDLRNILERSSARETTMRVAAGAIARQICAEFGISIYSHVQQIGPVVSPFSALHTELEPDSAEWKSVFENVEKAEMACADANANADMMKVIDEAKEKGTTVGGLVEVIATGLPVGLGSFIHWDRKLDAKIAYHMMSINAIKSVEIGMGKDVAATPGNQVHDEIFYNPDQAFYRTRNNAGGIEGGMSNGEPVVVRIAMKPIPTMVSPLQSVDVKTHKPKQAHYERADVCAVPAAAVVAEAMLALTLANALMDKIGGDSINEMHRNYKGLPSVPLQW